ncbi:MAG TPA: ATP-binding protein [Methylomirabilota bacterium]|nr:ATP-binding protein [Methylomirabilota bacterium]
MDTRRTIRYFLASIMLLIGLVAVHAVTAARRTQAEVSAQLAAKAAALANALEASSLNAIRSNALVEEMIAQRLTDNARLIDELLRRPLPPGELDRIVARNGLRRVDLLDAEGRPWTPPPPPMLGGTGTHMMSPGTHPMRFMWGRRWTSPTADESTTPVAPLAIRDRRFWEGSVFGVAIAASSFRGIIAVHADAAFVKNFAGEIGVERQIQAVARQAGVAQVAVLAADRTVLAHSDPALVGSRAPQASAAGLLEVSRPLRLDAVRTGTLTIGLSTDPIDRAWRDHARAAAWLAAGVLAIGAAGMGCIFYLQQRHLGERRRLEAEMARRERLASLGDVAAAFAHEVRNPLNAISMGLQRLRAEFSPEPCDQYTRFVDLMQSEVRRLNAIVEQFIGLARPLPLKSVTFELSELLGDVQALVEDEARQAGVSVRVEATRASPTVSADRDHLRQVLLNLVLNAAQAMRGAGGTVTLAAATTRDGAAITVTDTGPGIPADVLSRIFDPYFTTRRDGLGLGLTISRRIVEAHGGVLDVESRPGRTVFSITLPQSPT